MYYILFIHLSVDRYLNYSLFAIYFAIVNNAAMSMDVQMPLQEPDFSTFGHVPISKTAKPYFEEPLYFCP